MLPPKRPEPAISIIIPEDLGDPRSQPEFLVEWILQTCEASRFEIIVIMQQGDSARAATVQNRLRDEDTLLVCELSNEAAAYDIGARAARGRWLFLTENHVIPERECLQKTLAFLEEQPEKPVMIGSSQLGSSRVGRVEGKNFDYLLARYWSQPDSFHRVHIRGFVIERGCYFEAGGLPSRYGTYSQTVLSESLHKRGIEIRYLDEKLLQHVNCASWSDLTHDLIDTAGGNCLFRDEPRQNRQQLSSIPVPLSEKRRHALALLRSAFLPARDFSLKRRFQVRLSLFRLCFSNLCSSFLRGRTGNFFYYLAYSLAVLRFYLTWPGSDAEYREFLRIWRLIIRNVEANWRSSLRSPQVSGEADSFLKFSTHQLRGFHGLETWNGRLFRWSEPVCDVFVRLPATDHLLTLDTGCLLGRECHFPFSLYVNDRLIPSSEIQIENGRINCMLEASWLSEQPTRLTIVTAPIRERGGDLLHPRLLGMPLFELTFEALAEEGALDIRNAA